MFFDDDDYNDDDEGCTVAMVNGKNYKQYLLEQKLTRKVTDRAAAVYRHRGHHVSTNQNAHGYPR